MVVVTVTACAASQMIVPPSTCDAIISSTVVACGVPDDSDAGQFSGSDLSNKVALKAGLECNSLLLLKGSWWPGELLVNWWVHSTFHPSVVQSCTVLYSGVEV